jgi:CheY-like chemotaxis protein
MTYQVTVPGAYGPRIRCKACGSAVPLANAVGPNGSQSLACSNCGVVVLPLSAAADDRKTQWRVLVVDDEPDIRLLIRLLLRQDDRFLVVAEAEDGASAVALAGVHQPDFVLLDIAMPGTDGWTALSQIRASVPDCRVVMCSAASPNDHRQHLSEADGYVEKLQIREKIPDLLVSLSQR